MLSATVAKSYLRKTVSISVTERQPFAIWCFPEGESHCVWFDETGYALMPAPHVSGFLINVIDGDHAVKPGETIMEDRLFTNMHRILTVINELSLPVHESSIADIKNEELTAVVSEYAFPVQFSLRYDPGFTKQALIKLEPDFSRLVYIDLRSENRAFYKYK